MPGGGRVTNESSSVAEPNGEARAAVSGVSLGIHDPKFPGARHTDPAPVDRLCLQPFGLDTILALGGGDRRGA